MFRVLFFIAFILSFCKVEAQIYKGDVCYYVEAGSNISSSTTIYMVKFSGRRIVSESDSKSTVTEKLRESSSYYDKKLDKLLESPKNGYDYNTSLSTSSKEVYSTESLGMPVLVQTGMFSWEWQQPKNGYIYKAFSKDAKSMITWFENNSGEIKSKSYYVKIDKSDLLPKAVNRDFLYE